MIDGLTEQQSIFFNIFSGLVVGMSASFNRYGFQTGSDFKKGLRYHLLVNHPGRYTRFYDKISPTLEHFAYGYASSAVIFGFGGITSDFYPPHICENVADIAAAFTSVGLDTASEIVEDLNGDKFRMSQLMGTVFGFATSYLINNVESLEKLIGYLS